MTNDKSADEIVRGLRKYQNMGDAPVGHYWAVIVPKDVLKDAADMIKYLTAQLTASQQETRAAVEDLREANFCSQCRLYVANRCNGLHKRGKCADWKWRGPQEAEKEQTHDD